MKVGMGMMGCGKDRDLTWNREAPPTEEEWRLHRLCAVLGFIAAQAPRALQYIAGLHDHKGMLTVKWTVVPKDRWLQVAESAWCSDVGDGDKNVDHEVNGVAYP